MTKKAMKIFWNRRKGFTILELLVVIAIIGLLSAVVLASLNTSRRKSRDAKRISDIRQLQLALEIYFDQYGYYPTDPTDSQTLVDSAGDTESLVDSGAIPSLPKDPDGSDYIYAHAPDTNPTVYHLAAILEDEGHDALNSDTNCNSNFGGTCTFAPAQNGFDGTTPRVYDVTP